MTISAIAVDNMTLERNEYSNKTNKYFMGCSECQTVFITHYYYDNYNAAAHIYIIQIDTI